MSRTGNASYEEEQERELFPEVEREAQVERPPQREPATHTIHADLRKLVERGIFETGSLAFMPAFEAFKATSTASLLDLQAYSGMLWVTRDFCTVTQSLNAQNLDSFLRPVHFVLRFGNKPDNGCLIVSPFEANEVLPAVRLYKAADMAVYSPRTSLLSQPLEELKFCNFLGEASSIHRQVGIFLGLFAGTLYFSSYQQYLHTCRILGLYSPAMTGDIEDVESDGFMPPHARKAYDPAWDKECKFVKSPVPFLRRVVAMRRKGLSYARSHMGKVLAGEQLAGDDFKD